MKAMNVIRPALAILFLLMITASISLAGKTAVPAAKNVHTILKECIKYPPHTYANCPEGKVTVKFMISDEGKIIVRKISTDNEKFAECVKEQLGNIDLKQIKSPYNQLYSVTFTFKIV
jgi:hypothetical protein